MWFVLSKLFWLSYLLFAQITAWYSSPPEFDEALHKRFLERVQRGHEAQLTPNHGSDWNETLEYENNTVPSPVNLEPDYSSYTMEMKALVLLRENIQDIITKYPKFDDDFYLLQWLKVQDMRLPETEKMIRESVEWREKMGVENDSKTYPREFETEFRLDMTNLSRTGIPVAYVDASGWDYAAALEKHDANSLILYWAKLGVETENRMIAYNKKINAGNTKLYLNSTTGWIGIVSLQGFDTTQVLINSEVRRVSLEIIFNALNYFPGVFKHAIILNTGMGFTMVYALVKPFINFNHLKVDAYGTDRSEWESKVLEIVDKDHLPPFLLEDYSKTNCWFC